jgi:hypothetical protein
VHFVKIDRKIFHFALHVLVLDANLHQLGMFIARIPAHGFEHLAIENCRAAGAAIFGTQYIAPLRDLY